MNRDTGGHSLGYWMLTLVLMVVGVLGILTIGLPFLVFGVALVLLAPVRSRVVFRSSLAGIAAFFAVGILVAPLRCSTSMTVGNASGTQPTSCSNLLGITYRGSFSYNPPLWPALLMGAAAAAAAATLTAVLLRRQGAMEPTAV